MVFKHEGWTLYKKDVKLKGGKIQTIYYFSKGTPKSGTPCDKPDNMIVGVNKRTDFHILKRSKQIICCFNYVSIGKKKFEGKYNFLKHVEI